MSQVQTNVNQWEDERPPLPKWTIMIYLAGDNNLSANSIAIMQELEAAAYSEDVRVLACFDSNTPLPKGARYLEINYGRRRPGPKVRWGLHDDMARLRHIVVSPDLCGDDPISATPAYEPTAKVGLDRFLYWALRRHPAKRYMLILFGHGEAVAGNTFLADKNPPSFLRLPDFGKVLKKHFGGRKRKLSILACDNCVMNGIEAAFELRHQVDYMLGSQGLMLAVGWPYRKIINRVVESVKCPWPQRTINIAEAVLKVCARNLLDFALMERSSEQSLCNLNRLNDYPNVVGAVRKLALKLEEGLETDRWGKLKYPIVADVVRLARLQAQAYWNETFVDLYDFCELLMNACNNGLKQTMGLFESLPLDLSQSASSNLRFATLSAEQQRNATLKELALRWPPMALLDEIRCRCQDVLNYFRRPDKGSPQPEQYLVPNSYYICPELQYSHGLSVYFPWTMPENPIIFDPVDNKVEPEDYYLKTAFDEYKGYGFAKCEGGNWANFLLAFFKATLRNVRLFDFEYKEAGIGDSTFIRQELRKEDSASVISFNTYANAIDLNKSSSDVDSENACDCPTIKNYPRRFYLSPQDCLNRCRDDGRPVQTDAEHHGVCVNYLGWNFPPLLRDVIDCPPWPYPCQESEKSADGTPNTDVNTEVDQR